MRTPQAIAPPNTFPLASRLPRREHSSPDERCSNFRDVTTNLLWVHNQYINPGALHGRTTLSSELDASSGRRSGQRARKRPAGSAGHRLVLHRLPLPLEPHLLTTGRNRDEIGRKKRAEEELKKSGMTYTIVRPGGLLDEPKDGAASTGNVVMKGANAFGLPPRESPGSILREQVAQVCVAALTEPAAVNKVVEIIAKEDAPPLSFTQLFEGVPADDA